MSERGPSRWPWAVLAGFVALAVAGTVGVVINDEAIAEQVPFIVAFSMFGVVGALILSRARGNVVGGLLLYTACATGASFLAGEIVTYLIREGTTDGFVVVAAALLSSFGWLLGILPVLVYLPLLFPDGRLPSRSWRPFAWFSGVFLGVLFVGDTFGQTTLTGSTEDVVVENPLAIAALDRLYIPDAVVTVALLACLVGAIGSLVVRFRRSRGVERQQIKWVAFAVVFLLVSFVASEILLAAGVGGSLLESVVSGLAFLALPVSIGIAVLQYRLYDLDVVVKKALVAGTLALVVVLVYGAVVGAFGLVTAGEVSSRTLFVVALLLGLAFRPVSRFARRVADRFVYGRRATPYEVLAEFSERVGEAYATEDVLARMAQILGQGAGAATARIWLRIGGELRPSASWPVDAPPADAVVTDGDTLPDLAGEIAVEVRDSGDLLGALSVAMPANDPMNAARERLVHDLAAHAGLVLRNVRLVEELRASHRRLVAARDEERRRLERNIHDGAQQQLVALAVQARLARGVVARDQAKADDLLARMETDLQAALDDLRDLARGIYPPLLADQGLRAALEAQARRSPVDVTVEAEGLGRYPQEVEAAVYFSCLEALQNVAKYAEANSARVVLQQEDGHLTFEVADDGRGFDPAATGYGTGLQGIADRLAALDGGLDVRSRPGGGTSVTGTIEIPPTPGPSPDAEPSAAGSTVAEARVAEGAR